MKLVIMLAIMFILMGCSKSNKLHHATCFSGGKPTFIYPVTDYVYNFISKQWTFRMVQGGETITIKTNNECVVASMRK